MCKLFVFVSFLVALAFSAETRAQSNPGFTFGQVPTAAQWNGYFSEKQDVLTGSPFSVLGNASGSYAAPIWLPLTNCNATNQALTWIDNGGFGCNTISVTATPGGSSGQVQFNFSGALAGTPGITISGSTPTLTSPVVNGTFTGSAVVPAANGGSGEAGAITGALKGNGTSAYTQAACADLSNGASGCSTTVGTSATVNTGTSGATIPLNNGGFTQSGLANFTGGLQINGTATGVLATAAPDGTSVYVSSNTLSAYDGAGAFFLAKYIPTPGSDDCPAIQTALNDAATYGAAHGSGMVVGDGIIHNCLTQITYDPSVTSVDWRGGGLDAHTASFTGPLITVTQSHTPPNNTGGGGGAYYQTYKNVFRNGYFNGTGKAGSIDLFYFSTATGGPSNSYNSRSLFDYIAGKNFRYGETWGNNAYLVDIDHFEYHDMSVAIYAPISPATSNSGENIAHIYGSIGESNQAVLLGQPFVFNFVSVSFDFNTVWMEADYGRITCTQCHFEANGSAMTTPPFVLGDYSGSNIELIGGDVVVDGNAVITTTSCLVNIGPTARMFMDHFFMQSVFFSSGVMACGSGLIQIQNTETNKFGGPVITNYSAVKAYNFNSNSEVRTSNLLSDGSFEDGGAASKIEDLIWITSDTATIVSRTAGTNITIAISTDTARYGTYSLKVTKVGAATTAAAFCMAAPFSNMQLPNHAGSYSVAGSQTGSMTLTLQYMQLLGYDGNGVPVQGFAPITIPNSGANTVTLSGTPIAWTGDGQSQGPVEYARAQPWVTHLAICADLTAMNAGSVYFDGEVLGSN